METAVNQQKIGSDDPCLEQICSVVASICYHLPMNRSQSLWRTHRQRVPASADDSALASRCPQALTLERSRHTSGGCFWWCFLEWVKLAQSVDHSIKMHRKHSVKKSWVSQNVGAIWIDLDVRLSSPRQHHACCWKPRKNLPSAMLTVNNKPEVWSVEFSQQRVWLWK